MTGVSLGVVGPADLDLDLPPLDLWYSQGQLREMVEHPIGRTPDGRFGPGWRVKDAQGDQLSGSRLEDGVGNEAGDLADDGDKTALHALLYSL